MPHSNNLCYDFGPFRFDVTLRVLTRNGEVISLGDKAVEVLLVLLRNAGHLVSKEDLMKEVWPDSFVEESNLTQNIFRLRRVLGDDRVSARYIETVPRRGYRFVAEVNKGETGPRSSEIAEGAGTADRQTGPPPKLGVLPFVNATGSDALEYLAEGISDNIINNLSRISKLRVMSRSFMFRYKGSAVEPKKIAFEMKLDAMLVGKISARPAGMTISAELVDGNGFMLWGDSFDCELKDILEIQDEIARQISSALRLKLTGEEEKRITARYTENSEAYQAYMEGRFHWSRYTRKEIEKAIEHFRTAIELDPNYALAYSGIVDCYLRLATNYLPPENYLGTHGSPLNAGTLPHLTQTSESRVKRRYEWDWKVAEREIRRANELKTDYPAAHQWNAAYLYVRNLNSKALTYAGTSNDLKRSRSSVTRIPFNRLTLNEEVQVFCAIAREQMDVGNYEAARLVLSPWWSVGSWPKLIGMDSKSCADLLFTAGEVAGFVASAAQLPLGQKNAELLLSGSITLFEQLGSRMRVAEGQIELALSYYRQGKFDLGRSSFKAVLDALSLEDSELRCLALIRLASLERHAGRFQDALDSLSAAKAIIDVVGPWVSGRYHLELASTYQHLAAAETDSALFSEALHHYTESLCEFQAIGNLRMIGTAENNFGFLLLTMGDLSESVLHLGNASAMFEALEDKVRLAQVHDSFARLHLAERRYEAAEDSVDRAIDTLQLGDEDSLLAEVLTTKGVVCTRLKHYREAVRLFERAYAIASRCGDRQGAAHSLLLMLEEVGSELSSEDFKDIVYRLERLSQVESPALLRRIQKVITDSEFELDRSTRTD
jgi:DNA-binding winged helix-turn-helix (wHTH) protein/tetratricopeptide (TPR) repeat protein